MNAASESLVDWLDDYQALVDRAALVELRPRTQIEIGGADRATWLHNLTTNEVRKLQPGGGCETFLTEVHGKTVAHVFLFSGIETIILDAVGGQAETILKHLDHYLISERVTLEDRSAAWARFSWVALSRLRYCLPRPARRLRWSCWAMLRQRLQDARSGCGALT